MATDPDFIPAPAPENESADVEKNKAFAILAYLWLLFLVPLLAAPNSRFARYHTNQGIILFLASLVLWVAVWIVALIPGLHMLARLADDAMKVVVLAFMIIGIVNAAQGKFKPLPLIGGFRIVK